MFEKEAEEYNQKVPFNPLNVEKEIRRAFQKGAEFGYNKTKVDLERKIEELEKEIKHKNKQLRAEFEAQIENIDLKEQIKAMKKYLDCDFCEYQNNKDECHQCNYLEKTRWTLKKEIKEI